MQIKGKRIYENLSRADLVEIALKTEDCILTDSGALAVSTGKYTGRSPLDRYIVEQQESSQEINWGKDNLKITENQYSLIYDKIIGHLNNKELYCLHGYANADKNYRTGIKVVTEYASQCLFMQNMLIMPKKEELKDFSYKYTILSAPSLMLDKDECKINSECAIIINLKERVVLIAGTKYSGELKKSVFSLMNYVLPKEGVLSMHCSANMGSDGSSALFFGLSGTGKTTLSADPNRKLIGDDEHGWSDNGIFNIEGGCYAKCINLSPIHEKQIYEAIKFGALTENVVYDKKTRLPDYSDSSLTENTRVSYPVDFIPDCVLDGVGGHPKTIIFLSADAFGVLPPVSKLTKEQAMYYYLSGYTAKLAGTERGVIEPQATFSTCFGSPFLPLKSEVYAKLLGEKIEKYNVSVYLINTGWIGGRYGVGKRISIFDTRAIVSAALNDLFVDFEQEPYFGLFIPKGLSGIDSSILNPKNSWADAEEYEKSAKILADLFMQNFKKYSGIPKQIIQAGPMAN